MKFHFVILGILIPLLAACQNTSKERAAMKLAERAMKTFSHHADNIDSTNRALNLIDSSLRLYQSPKLYFCKYQIYKGKNDELAALYVCDTALMLDRTDFPFTLEKGCTLEVLGRLDSAFRYYRIALQMVDSPTSFDAAEIVKDDEKIVITGLLKDTVTFKKLVSEFRTKYQGSKNKYFEMYSKQLDHFKREDYVN
jgi:tetratricopeptide (TPR) repeat protein